MTVEIISWSISTKVWYRTGIELATPGSAVRHESVARHVTNCATRPGWANIIFWHSKSYFDIRTWAEYRILTFKLRPNIVFSHAKSYFDIQMGPNIVFWHKNQILTFKMGPNIVFWHSKSFSDIRYWAEYRILTFQILFLNVKLGRIYHILTFKILLCHSNCRRIIVFWHSKSYFGIRNWAEVAFRHSKSYFEIRNEPNVVFWH